MEKKIIKGEFDKLKDRLSNLADYIIFDIIS